MKIIFANQNCKKSIRIALIATIALFCFIGQAEAQDCYNKNRSNGVAAMQKKDYDKAIKLFELANDCPDKPDSNDLDAKIKECKRLKNQAIQDKKDAEKKKQEEKEARIREEEEARIREEQERQAQEHEQDMARKAYMEISGIDFYNVSFDGTNISKQGEQLYVQDMKALKAVINYDGMDNITRKTTLYCKLIGPDNQTVTDKNSRGGYSWQQDVNVEPGEGNQLFLNSWSSTAFRKGAYRLEIYSYEKRIYSNQFYIDEKIPEVQTAKLTLRSSDNNADIHIDGDWRGKNGCTVDLEPGTYKIECCREKHRPSKKTITVTLDVNGQTITLDPPTPITGNLHVESPKKNTQVYLDGDPQGVAPRDFTGLLIGEHKVVFTKDKFYNDVRTITITENKTANLTANMYRIKHTPGILTWIWSETNAFAYYFLSPIYAFDGSIGGNFTYCKRHIGLYGQYLYGLDDKHNSYSGGAVLRLTYSGVDLQMLGGVAYNAYKTTYSSDTDSQILANVGLRIGWKSRSKFSWWDIMGGYMLNKDQKIPYVGVGLGTSLVGLGIFYLSAYLQ